MNHRLGAASGTVPESLSDWEGGEDERGKISGKHLEGSGRRPSVADTCNGHHTLIFECETCGEPFVDVDTAGTGG